MPNVTGAPFTGHGLQPSARRTRGKSPSHRPRQRSRSSRQRKRSPAHSCPLELNFKRCICTKMMNMSNMTKCRGVRGTAVSCRSCRRPSVYLLLHFLLPLWGVQLLPEVRDATIAHEEHRGHGHFACPDGGKNPVTRDRLVGAKPVLWGALF